MQMKIRHMITLIIRMMGQMASWPSMCLYALKEPIQIQQNSYLHLEQTM